MFEASKKGCLINLWLMAFADGEYHPNEKKWIQAFIQEADIDPQDAERWFRELSGGGLDWQTIEDRADAKDLLKIAVGVIGADNRLDARERAALFQLGKALGFEIEEVAQVLSISWGKNVMLEVFPTRTIPPPPGAYVIVTDDFPGIGRFVDASRGVEFEERSFDELRKQSGAPAVVVLHASADRDQSIARLERLKQKLPTSQFFFVVERHQANQVSYALENGAAKCLVEPIFKNEFTKVLLDL
jgi:tellurite resistance protein